MTDSLMQDGLVSIITPSYNCAGFVCHMIESVRNQTYQNWELLITDDGSSDNSVGEINRYVTEDSRIKLFVSEKNRGAALARNNSLEQAKGRYIAFLDSDDLWSSSKLERQIGFMQKHGYAFTITAYDTICEDGTSIDRVIRVPRTLRYKQYLRNTIIGCLTVVIDRKQVGEFRMPEIKSSQDMALWLSIMRKGFEVNGLNEVLATYRLVANSNTAKKWKAAKDVWKVYRDFEHLPWYSAVYNFIGYTLNAIRKRL